MKYVDWDDKENQKLKKERQISFDEVVIAIIEDNLLDIIDNPSKNFANQKVFVVKINNYIYYVPYVEDHEKIFLKTIISSRKATKKYLSKK